MALAEALKLFEPAQPAQQQKRLEPGRKAEEGMEEEKVRADAKVLPGLGLTLGAKVISAAPTAVNALASVIGMFRSDYAITNREVTIGTTPLIAAVAGRLTGDANVVAGGFGLVEGSAVAGQFWTAWSDRSELERRKVRVSSERIAPADKALATLQQLLKTAGAALEKVMADADSSAEVIGRLADREKSLRREIERIEKSVAEDRADVAVADAVLARFDDFAKAVTNTPRARLTRRSSRPLSRSVSARQTVRRSRMFCTSGSRAREARRSPAATSSCFRGSRTSAASRYRTSSSTSRKR